MTAPNLESMQAALAFLTQFFGPGGPEEPPFPQSTPFPGPASRPSAQGGAQARALPTDLALIDTNLILSIAIPGLPSPQALTLRLLSPTELLVEAWLPPSPGLPLQTEIPTGMQSRLFQLPASVIAASLVTRYSEGVLTLTFARAPA